jgi:hypothetical protein
LDWRTGTVSDQISDHRAVGLVLTETAASSYGAQSQTIGTSQEGGSTRRCNSASRTFIASVRSLDRQRM